MNYIIQINIVTLHTAAKEKERGTNVPESLEVESMSPYPT